MTAGDQIQYLSHRQIDKEKWDNCLHQSANGLVYAYSYYLDCMAKGWHALVLNDYDAVMPLPAKKKFGINYLYQPFLTPVLGVFGKNIAEQLVNSFLESIPPFFKLWDISLNHSNPVPKKFGRQFKRNNYILGLNRPYVTIAASYSDNISRNITKAIKAGCIIKKDIPLNEIISICRREWPKFTNPGDESFDLITTNFSSFSSFASSYGVYHPDGKLLSSCTFLKYQKRAYYWLVGNEPEAKEFGASPMLIDQFIKDHADQDLVLDFEGSDSPTVAEFYRRFGAIPEPYTTIYANKLPFPLSLLKSIPPDYKRLTS